MSAKQSLGTAALFLGAAAILNKALKKSAYDFAGKVVLITGGSRGLGLVMARQFAKRGAHIAICARDQQELENARRDLEARGASVFMMVCDVTDRAAVEYMTTEVAAHFGHIDVLVNNAGIIQVGPLDVMTVADFENAMNTHFWGALYPTLAVLPQMKARRSGRIVNITSIGGKISVPHLVPYSASKFALVGLSEGLRAELKNEGIIVTTVCPGLMRTGSPRNASFKGKNRAEYAWFSISDSAPLLSISAERAARQVVEACAHGDAQIVLSLPAQLAVLFHGIFPGLTSDLMAAANLLLPAAGGIGKQEAKGFESESKFSPSILTTLTEKAAAKNNEQGGNVIASKASTTAHPNSKDRDRRTPTIEKQSRRAPPPHLR